MDETDGHCFLSGLCSRNDNPLRAFSPEVTQHNINSVSAELFLQSILQLATSVSERSGRRAVDSRSRQGLV
jgi:hypothetical protein